MSKWEQSTIPAFVMQETSVRILAAVDGRSFDVVILAAGKSKNAIGGKPILYLPETLKAAVPLFEGAAVNAHRFGQEFDHVADDAVDKSVFALNTVGVLEGVHYGEDALRGRLVLHEGADFIAGLLKLSIERDKPLVGLSIDARGEIEFRVHEGEEVAAVTSLNESPTVDIVSRPAAGGEIVRLAASMQKEKPMPKPEDTKPQGGEDKPEAAEAKPVKEAVADKAATDLRDFKENLAKEREDFRKELDEMQKAHKCGLLLERRLAESNLPDEARELVREKFDGQVFEEDALDERIGMVRKLTASADKTGEVDTPIKIGKERRDRCDIALQHMWCQNTHLAESVEKELREEGLDPIVSLHKFTRENFGVDLTDGLGSMDTRRRLKESLTTSSWAEVFGDNANKALLRQYPHPDYTDWRKIVRVVPLKDFQTQHMIRMGGYGNLPTVVEGANYTALTSPGDEEQTYSAVKKGGTDDLTREMILADDVGAIARLIPGLNVSASRTLYEYVFDLITIAGQPTMGYDSTTLFHADHSNLGTTALATAEVGVVWKAMQKYAELTSSKRLGVRPKFLCVPVDLAETAFGIVKPLSEYAPGETTNQAWVRTMMLEVIVVMHWTNTKDHFYVADPTLYEGFVMGFVGGNQAPQLFVQDLANVGAGFDSDSQIFKIRHEYGGTPVDHRAFYAEDVA